MKGVAGVRCGHDPLVVGFVEMLIDSRMVEASVDEVNKTVGEYEEERELNIVVGGEWCFFQLVVEFCVALDFSDKEQGCQNRHARHGLHGLLDLLADLILQVLRMIEGSFIENEDVGECSENPVKYYAKEPAYVSDISRQV